MIPNVQAFLAMIAHAEGTDRATDPYRVCYGFHHLIASFADHPALTGEWMGERITVGIYAGELSTAAGRYQINKPTWLRLKAKLGLICFDPTSQDDAAIQLISDNCALSLIRDGKLGAAVTKLSAIWASLPGGDSGQQEQLFASLQAAYTGAGGALA
jgi:muramidase (phage lysozyme)